MHGIELSQLAIAPAVSDADLEGMIHVRALVTREGDRRYRLWFGQEYADYLADVVVDADAGLS